MPPVDTLKLRINIVSNPGGLICPDGISFRGSQHHDGTQREQVTRESDPPFWFSVSNISLKFLVTLTPIDPNNVRRAA